MATVEMSKDELVTLIWELEEKYKVIWQGYEQDILAMLKSKWLYRVVFRMKTLDDWHDYLRGNFLRMDEAMYWIKLENLQEFIDELKIFPSMGKGCSLSQGDMDKIRTIESKYIDVLNKNR